MLTNARLYFTGDHQDELPTEVSPEDPLPVRLPNPLVQTGLFESEWVQADYGATSGALDANDAMGNVFKIAVPTKGRILSIKMLDLDDDTLAATIHLYSANFTGAASDAAYTVADTDANSWVASELFDAGTDEGSFKAHVIKDVNVEYVANGGYLYAQLSTSGTPNIADQTVMPKVKLFIQPLG